MKVLYLKKVPIVSLDSLDKKILFSLSKNSRFPLSKIAKIVRKKPGTVNYRFNKLISSKVITGFRTCVNTRSLGYLSFHILLDLGGISEDTKNKMISSLKKNKNVNVIITYTGKWNLELGVFSKDISSFNDFLKELFSSFKINDYLILILGDTIKSSILPKSFFKGIDLSRLNFSKFKNDYSFHKDFLIRKKIPLQLDNKDKLILSFLSNDCLISNNILAKKVGLSKETLVKKIKNLIHSGIIVDFRPVINFSSLGYSLQSVLLTLTQEGYRSLDKVKSFLKESDDVLWATFSKGGADVLIYTLYQDPFLIHDFINELRLAVPGAISSFEILFAYEEHKYLFYPEII